jgi:hypothetical protein
MARKKTAGTKRPGSTATIDNTAASASVSSIVGRLAVDLAALAKTLASTDEEG